MTSDHPLKNFPFPGESYRNTWLLASSTSSCHKRHPNWSNGRGIVSVLHRVSERKYPFLFLVITLANKDRFLQNSFSYFHTCDRHKATVELSTV